jgi:hypothetical protein
MQDLQAVRKQEEQTGVDRIKVRDGKVVENRIFFDRREFERKPGGRSLCERSPQ